MQKKILLEKKQIEKANEVDEIIATVNSYPENMVQKI